jgi:hypothetical protein
MNDEKVILTPAEAEALLLPGEHVHNFANPGAGLFVGCDYDRADAIAAFQRAKQIELGGPGCTGMKHPIVVWENERRCTFFEADMDKVKAFEAARA